MKEQFFIGRTKDLEKLEGFTLRPGPHVHRPKIAHISGPEGVGKTALLRKFISILSEESVPILHCYPGPIEADELEDTRFYQQMINSIGSNIGELLPWLEELKTNFYTPEEETSIDGFWAQKLVGLIDTISSESSVEVSDLQIIFAIDDIALLPLNQRIGICSLVKHLCKQASPAVHISVITTGDQHLQAIPDVGTFWKPSFPEALQLQLKNLTREETTRLLESHDLDSNLIAKIFMQTEGNPGQIIEALQSQDLETINFEESYNRGKNMMYQFNNFHRRWIEWAAIIKYCNGETIAMITEGSEVQECMNWIRNNYPTIFLREGNDYILNPDIRRAILAYVKRDEPELFREISEVVQKLAGVKHTIPNAQHRFLLSKLADLNYFDLDLLKKVFDDDTYKALLNLIESKPIFFRQELDSYRLASNIRASISIYNGLRENPEREKFRYRVRGIWTERQKTLIQDLAKTEQDLSQIEERNRSLTNSVNKIQEEITKLKNIQAREHKTVAPVIKTHRPKRLSMLGAFLLQATGIAILYVDTLIFKHMSLSYVMLAIICIISGIILGVKGPSTPVTVTSSGSSNQKQSENYQHVVRNLEIDLMNLVSQKEQVQNKIEIDRQKIANLQTLRTYSYLPDSDS